MVVPGLCAGADPSVITVLQSKKIKKKIFFVKALSNLSNKINFEDILLFYLILDTHKINLNTH